MSYNVYKYICINPECNNGTVTFETDRDGVIILYCSKCGKELHRVEL